jgi:DNA modification methylase
MTPPEVFAIGLRRSNATLIKDLHQLGWLLDDDRILDPTYGKGKWWTQWRPKAGVTATDLNAKLDVGVANFLALPWASHAFDVVAFDPPYKLNGTPGKSGPAALDAAYGVDGKAYFRWQDRMEICKGGIVECGRVAKRILLVKCMDQVCSGDVRWQTHEFKDVAEANGFRLVDKLHVRGYRAQSAKNQEHARRDYSTMLVFERRPKVRSIKRTEHTD